MKAIFIEEIPKTQNYMHTKNGKEIIEGDFFYSDNDFIGKHIEIKFPPKDILASLTYGCDSIQDIVNKTIYEKIEELKKAYGLLIKYEVVKSEVNSDGAMITCLITACEADC